MGAALDQVGVIDAAMRRGWRPDPGELRGVTIAGLLHQGDCYGRFWTLVDDSRVDPRELAHPFEDGPLLAIAADAATTYLNSRG
jgi:hypothetical protein